MGWATMWNSSKRTSMETITQDTAGELELSGALDIYRADAVRQQFLSALSVQRELMLDLAGVQTCDTAGIQLLWAAHKTAEADGRRLSIRNPSAAVQELWTALGMPAEFFTSSTPCHQ